MVHYGRKAFIVYDHQIEIKKNYPSHSSPMWLFGCCAVYTTMLNKYI